MQRFKDFAQLLLQIRVGRIGVCRALHLRLIFRQVTLAQMEQH